ncbi:esterase-like activity of phytase family protein [Streptomyces sp. Je 1-4]|uniref:esterase-like activity of phytase family protein n=1 Tax=Streptomyces TaxID=1883 RepID=UPI0021D84B81|nr:MULTISPECIES: esterase-like activity of phytase family protein [unclassified Streptomyces]UYB40515.1 esterase-like activity of phytase family protein [Streptomyces sp. Je 1-4]UZQ36641.1 esterase-like activity of phytase family protein [Streptomyces sp. Je 1-4] [Streptomyces sp. Je 1-4 4N24]UZQ44058.1 esterase-like activity of phytase family protein [Streptomyces sp. Je 1-4] [Streptomyces sp. Je 1-4 4N24_ara]
MRSLLCAAGAAGILWSAAVVPAAADEPDGFTIGDPRITESSGLTASRTHPGIYWTHNDSDDGPYLYAVDGKSGRTVARITLRGVGAPRDVEAISAGPDGDLYVGDIGDNLGGSWSHVWIYRFPEPKRLRDTTVTATQFVVKYADGPRDAEAMMVHPKTGRVYLASKKQGGGGALYEGPRQLTASGANTFRKVGPVDLWVTDGAFSPDGTRLVLRSYFGSRIYRWQDGRPKDLGSVGVPVQQQGESVTFSADGRTLMYGSEGGDSAVEPVGLSDEQLPDAAKDDPANGDGANGQEGKGGSSTDLDPSFLKGAMVLALATGLVVALRRLVRRR